MATTSPNAAPSAHTFRIGTRGSALALWQARAVQGMLLERHPGAPSMLEVIKPEGDLDKRSSLLAIGGRGVFASALQEALLDGSIDLAVHSTKDVPTIEPAGLAIAAFPMREDARDAVVSRHGAGLAELPSNPVVGTSSRRRAVQVKAIRPDAIIADLRGNIDTRLRKAASDSFDAVILAAAGLARMGWTDRITEHLAYERFVPSPGQGALAVETRAAPDPAFAAAAALDDAGVSLAVRLERAFLSAMGGGCTTPVGAHADVEGDLVLFWAMLASDDGTRISHVYQEFSIITAEEEVPVLASRMLADLSRAWAGASPAQPLAGKQALVTGTADLVTRLTEAFVAEGAPVHAAPTLEILPSSTPQALVQAFRAVEAGDYDWIVVTSKESVPALQRFGAERLEGKAKIAAVGTATAAEIEALGLVVHRTPARQTGAGLVESFDGVDLAGKRMLCLLGSSARPSVPDGLVAMGAHVDRVESYVSRPVGDLPPPARAAVRAGDIDIVTLASPASVETLVRNLGVDLAALSGACLAAIGPTTQEAMERAGLPVHVVAAEPTSAGLVAACRTYFGQRFG